MPSSTTGRVGTAPNAKTVAFHTHQFNDIEQPVKAKPFVKGKKTDDVEFTIVTAASNAVNDTEHNEGHNATSDAMSPPDAAIGATRAADVSRSEKDKALVHTVPSGGGAGSMNSHAINYTLPTLTNKSPAAIESAQKQGVLIGQQMGRSSFSSSSLSSTASIPSSSRKTTSAEGKRSRAIKGGSRTARSVRKHNYKYKHAHTDHYTSVKYNNNNNDNHSKANQYNAELETDRAAVRRFHNRPRPRSIQPGQSQGGRGRIGKKTFVHTQKYEHYNIEKKHKNATSTHSDSSKSQHRKTVNRSTNSRSASNDNRDNVNGDVKKGEHQSNSGVHLESDVSVLRQQKGLRDAMVQGFLQKQEGSAHTTHSSGTHHPNRKRAPLVEEELVADGSSQDLNQKQRNDQDMDSKFSEEVEEEIINPQYNLSSW